MEYSNSECICIFIISAGIKQKHARVFFFLWRLLFAYFFSTGGILWEANFFTNILNPLTLSVNTNSRIYFVRRFACIKTHKKGSKIGLIFVLNCLTYGGIFTFARPPAWCV